MGFIVGVALSYTDNPYPDGQPLKRSEQSEDLLNGKESRFFCFITKEQCDAFIRGVEEGVGWQEILNLDDFKDF
jgi:hypothetical protein